MQRFLFILFLFLLSVTCEATHLMGGSMTYTYNGVDIPTGKNKFHITLKIYRYCEGGTATLDASMMMGIYPQDILVPNDDKIWQETVVLPLTVQQFIDPPSLGSTCNFTPSVCVEQGIFEADILLDPSTGGYHLQVERCCRNGNIINLSSPGSIGQTYYCFIPPSPIINSSPILPDIAVPYLCSGDTVSVVNNAIDPDGDSLVYSFETPFIGNSTSGAASPDPQLDNNPYAIPINNALYTPGFSVANPFGSTGYASIDPFTGLTQYFIPNQGFYVIVIEIKEYRNGVLIASVRRDIQLIAIVCPPNSPPNLDAAIPGNTITSYTITEGDPLVFDLFFIDPDNDSLYITSSGNIFNGAITNPPAVLPNAAGETGLVSTVFAWFTECGQAKATPYQFTVTVTDNGCPPKIRNVIYSIKVNPGPANPAPSVTIRSSPAGPICTGTPVTFTALPTFGGASPQFQWFLNGNPIGTNSSTFSSSTLNNADIITVSLTSNSVCVNVFSAISPPVVMVVNPFVSPTVSINVLPVGAVCAGTNLTYAATVVNGGASPTYQWMLNGVNIAGEVASTFSSATLSNGNSISVAVTSNMACPGANSNSIVATVNPNVIPSITISTATVFPICPGQGVTFISIPVNGGLAPVFVWKINGVIVAGAIASTFATTALAGGDVVSVVLTSNANCPTTNNVASNNIVATATTPTNPVVTISANPTVPICAGEDVIFTAAPVNGGTAPSYLWQINGINTGTNSSSLITSALTNGSKVRVILTSNSACATTPKDTSNEITITVDPILKPTVTINTAAVFPLCLGSTATFIATPVNGGTTPVYQWQINGVAQASTGSSFTPASLVQGDVIRVRLTSNARCAAPSTALSNIYTATFIAPVAPSVAIVVSPGSTICSGTQVTFTAAPVNQGTAPVYQWKINNVIVGSNQNTFASSTLQTGDDVLVVMTSNKFCIAPPAVTSNVISMTVNPLLAPFIGLTATPGNIICDGTPVTFNSVTNNGGAAPQIKWFLNNVYTGVNASSFSSSTLNHSDEIKAVLISNAICATPKNDTSAIVVMTVNPNVTPTISLAASSTNICAGDNVLFTATFNHEGTNPVYTWFKNGVAYPGINQPTLSTFLLSNGDTITIQLTSNAICRTANTALSNQIVMTVNPILIPVVSLTANPAVPICPNDLVQITATPTNPGNAPVYDWYINNIFQQSGGNVFNYSNYQNGDVVKSILHSNAICVRPDSAVSPTVTVTVNINLTPAINIVQTPAGIICDQLPITYISSVQNEGLTPVYQWQINGVNVGANSSTYTSTAIKNNDVISCILTSSATCALPVIDTSNLVITGIDPILLPAINITANPPGTFCDGKIITYNSAVSNEGSAAQYRWFINGVFTGQTSNDYISSLLQDNDTIEAELVSSVHCPLQNPVMSNEIIIDRLPPLVPLITGDPEMCFGKLAAIQVTTTGGDGGPYYYIWDNGLGTADNFILSPDSTTTYTVTVSDSCSTIRSTNFVITVNPLPIPAFAIDPPQATILNPYFDFNDASLITSQWKWNLGDGSTSIFSSPQHTYEIAGYYTVQLIAMSDKGCVDSLSKELYVEEVATAYIPNSFTPNHDGKNDFFGPIGHAMPPYSITIFNRWGNKIFAANGNNKFWNGTYDGKPAHTGVYVYVIVFNDPMLSKTYKGEVTLVR